MSWHTGDTVVLAATGYDQAEAEKVVIGDARHRSGTGYGSPTVLQSTSTLTHRHFAAIEKHSNFDVDMRAEVALVSRNIEVHSIDMHDSDFNFKPQDRGSITFGYRVSVLAGGEANFQAVRFVKGGSFESPKVYSPTIRFASAGSVARSCVFDEMFSQPIRVQARAVVVDRNVVINSVMSAIKVVTAGAIVTNNLVLGAHCFPLCAGCCGKWAVFAGAYEVDAGASDDLTFTGNVAAGGPIGFKFNTAPPGIFHDNTVHSTQIGIAVNGACEGRPVRLRDTIVLHPRVRTHGPARTRVALPVNRARTRGALPVRRRCTALGTLRCGGTRRVLVTSSSLTTSCWWTRRSA